MNNLLYVNICNCNAYSVIFIFYLVKCRYPLFIQVFCSFIFFLFVYNSLLIPIKQLTYIHTENVILSFVIFRMISKSQKKEEIYNILIINNLYINIYFFCFQFLEK